MKRIALLGLVVASFASPVFAADMPIKAPMAAPVPMFSWTGCYVGAQVGYGWGSGDHSFSNGAPSDSSKLTGWVGGGHLGCNYQFSKSFVIGAEGDYEAANLNGSFVNATGGTSVGSVNMTSDGSLRARLGVAFDRSLLYATGGWAFANFNIGGGPIPAPPCCGYSASQSGWTAGVGWEYAFTDHFTGRIEYRHADYGTARGTLAPTFPGVTMPVRLTTDVVRTGLTYKF